MIIQINHNYKPIKCSLKFMFLVQFQGKGGRLNIIFCIGEAEIQDFLVTWSVNIVPLSETKY